ncbi:unnamed protein product [Rotaria sp. Silwood1]|nr:unnamed protein product [Rotaria sp. Silwood1]
MLARALNRVQHRQSQILILDEPDQGLSNETTFCIMSDIVQWFKDPYRSPSRSPPPFSDENNNYDFYNETEFLDNIAEKKAEMRHTQELLNERMRQAQITLVQLRQVNQLLKQFKTPRRIHENTKS